MSAVIQPSAMYMLLTEPGTSLHYEYDAPVKALGVLLC